MRPTKRTKVHRVESPIPSHTGAPISKLLKLKYLINDRTKEDRGKFRAVSNKQTNYHFEGDKTWVMEEITNLRNDGWLTATKMKVANEMWKQWKERDFIVG